MNDTIADRVLRSDFFRNYQNAFAAGIGLPLDFVPANEAHRLPYEGHENESDFCRQLREGAGQSWEIANAIVETEAQVNGGAVTTTTIGGMLESAIPIRNNKVTVGYLRLGQARQSQPTEAGFKQAVARLSEKRGLYDMTRLKEAYFEVTVMPLNRYAGIVELVDLFAHQLEGHINRLVIMRQNEEPAAVTKTKRFIVENFAENLSLGQMAFQSGVSTFYLCKCFKKATGMTLTEFIGRVRIEKAKLILLNSSHSISEIALDVGFNSLSQFNRMFSRYVGEPPTKFRCGVKEVEKEATLGAPDRRSAQITLLSVAS
ncbi:helix-turn-helix domain-containing protein [bacterium]|jgi:AraC-like DNA-binding protein|nr:helix-turn-helix domain-containing protein [bacterium]MDF1789504.1 helix-turn-helix domain-containing protein [Verrucomicrobiales bacterium]